MKKTWWSWHGGKWRYVWADGWYGMGMNEKKMKKVRGFGCFVFDIFGLDR